MQITKLPHPILAKKTLRVPVEDIKRGGFDALVAEMKKIMKEKSGVGLAANQIGQNLSIFVIDPELARANEIPDAFFNPEIIEYSKDSDEMEEGCLSIPEYYTPVKRSKKIRIKAIDGQGNKIKLKVRGFAARVLQHETDHLNGKTIKDRK